jgi:hypothetical protein
MSSAIWPAVPRQEGISPVNHLSILRHHKYSQLSCGRDWCRCTRTMFEDGEGLVHCPCSGWLVLEVEFRGSELAFANCRRCGAGTRDIREVCNG